MNSRQQRRQFGAVLRDCAQLLQSLGVPCVSAPGKKSIPSKTISFFVAAPFSKPNHCPDPRREGKRQLDVTTTATTVSSLKQDSDFDVTGDEVQDCDSGDEVQDCDSGDEAQDCDSGDETQDCDSGTTDTALYRIMEEKQSECFKNLDEVTAIIDAYEARTGNRLRIQKSLKDKFRVYHCCVHVDCRFQVRFSRRRSDGLFVVSRLKPKHSSVQRPSRAADGRQLKKRRQGRLDDIVVQVLQTKRELRRLVTSLKLLAPRTTCPCHTRSHIAP